MGWRELLQELGIAQFPVTSGFGQRGKEFHTGTDLGVPSGTPLKSPVGAVAVQAGYEEGGYGNFLKFLYADGHSLILGHLSEFVGIKPGEVIKFPKPGSVFGKSGSTGRSTGPHAHLELRDKTGKPLNPFAAGAQWVPPTAAEIQAAIDKGFPLAPYLVPGKEEGRALEAGHPGLSTITEADNDAANLSAAESFLGFSFSSLKGGAVSVAGAVVALLLLLGGVVLLGLSFNAPEAA